MCQYMTPVGIYHIIEELSYFHLRKIKIPKYYVVRNKVSLIIPHFLMETSLTGFFSCATLTAS